MLIAIVGATGTGKSNLSLGLAERLAEGGSTVEIVNADAMQLYRGMDVGTAKLPISERRGIPHHLLDVLDPEQEASVADYQVEARAAIADIQSRGCIPLLVGGSGLYVSSVLWDFRFPGTDPGIRAALEADLEAQGPGLLHRRLKELDSEAADAIGASNGRRLVRALEVIQLTGEKFGSGLPDESTLAQPVTFLGIQSPRDVLVARLDERVRGMWRAGLVEEVRALGTERLGVTAKRAIGYAQALGQLDGSLGEDEAIAQTQALTRRYARRQVGWFRRYPSTTWLDADDPAIVDTAAGVVGSLGTISP